MKTREEKIEELTKKLEGVAPQLGKLPRRIAFWYMYHSGKDENSIYMAQFQNERIQMQNIKYEDLKLVSVDPQQHSAPLNVHVIESVPQLAEVLIDYNEKWVEPRKKKEEEEVAIYRDHQFECAKCETENTVRTIFFSKEKEEYEGKQIPIIEEHVEQFSYAGEYICANCHEETEFTVSKRIVEL